MKDQIDTYERVLRSLPNKTAKDRRKIEHVEYTIQLLREDLKRFAERYGEELSDYGTESDESEASVLDSDDDESVVRLDSNISKTGPHRRTTVR